jgi:8-oxo-dGTP pyrophosphatase MutT (NUDIX family)
VDGFVRRSEEPIFDGHLFSVRRVTYVDPEGETFDREIVRHPGAVTVVPVHEDGTVTLVRQLRVPVGEPVLEAPAGTCDVDGEDLEATASRELEEEAGLRPGRLRYLASVYNSPGYTDQKTAIFLATDLEPGRARPSGAEERFLSVEQVQLADVEDLVAGGRLVDSTTIVGLLLARRMLSSSGSGSGA